MAQCLIYFFSVSRRGGLTSRSFAMQSENLEQYLSEKLLHDKPFHLLLGIVCRIFMLNYLRRSQFYSNYKLKAETYLVPKKPQSKKGIVCSPGLCHLRCGETYPVRWCCEKWTWWLFSECLRAHVWGPARWREGPSLFPSLWFPDGYCQVMFHLSHEDSMFKAHNPWPNTEYLIPTGRLASCLNGKRRAAI